MFFHIAAPFRHRHTHHQVSTIPEEETRKSSEGNTMQCNMTTQHPRCTFFFHVTALSRHRHTHHNHRSHYHHHHQRHRGGGPPPVANPMAPPGHAVSMPVMEKSTQAMAALENSLTHTTISASTTIPPSSATATAMTADASTSMRISSCSLQTDETQNVSQIIYFDPAKNDEARKDEATQAEARKEKERALEERKAAAAEATAATATVVKLNSNEASDEDEDFILVDYLNLKK